jgi:hypothetical protein
MGKKFKLNLSVPEPCTENWDNMTPNERGRHCASCDKTVIDFSLFSDKQLIEFFSKATDKICGRIPKFQLERQIIFSEPPKHPFFNKLLFGTALAAGLTINAAAQQNDTKPQTTKTTKEKENIESINPAISQEIPMINESEEPRTDSTQNRPGEFIGVLGGITMEVISVEDSQFELDEKTKQYIEQRANGGIDRAPSIFPKYKEGNGY